MTLFRLIGRRRAQVPAGRLVPWPVPPLRDRAECPPGPAAAGPDPWPDSSETAFRAARLDARFDPCGAPPVGRRS